MYKLLIVDDEYEIRHGISNYFPWDELGFIVAGEAENGQDALEFLADQPVDVILCDIKMPIKSGLDLARELNEKNDKTKIVFLTGYKDFNYIKEALIYGAKDYILKPTKHKELAEVFQKIKNELDRESQPEVQNIVKIAGEDPRIQKIKAYVGNNLCTVSLKDAARIIHMNPYYVSAFFKKKTGMPFTNYVISIKMKKAAIYLAYPEYKTYEISDLVGYSNPKNFSKTFKAYYGKNPREYRIESIGKE